MGSWERAVVRVDRGSSAAVVLRAGCHEVWGRMRLRVCNVVSGRASAPSTGVSRQTGAERWA